MFNSLLILDKNFALTYWTILKTQTKDLNEFLNNKEVHMKSLFNFAFLATFCISGSVHAQTVSVSMVEIQSGEFLMGSPTTEFERG